MNKDVRGREISQQGLPNLNGPGLFRTLLNALNQGLSELVRTQKCRISTSSDRNAGSIAVLEDSPALMLWTEK